MVSREHAATHHNTALHINVHARANGNSVCAVHGALPLGTIAIAAAAIAGLGLGTAPTGSTVTTIRHIRTGTGTSAGTSAS